MGEKGRYVGLGCVAVVLVTALSAATPRGAQSQTESSAGAAPPVVSPFFIVPRSRSPRRPTLTSLSVVSVTRNERVTSACSGCGSTRFVETREADRVMLRASPPLRMRSPTRVIVGVTASGSTGRWIVFGLRRLHYTGFGHGCMLASVTVLSPVVAARPSRLQQTPCGPPSPPGTEYVLFNGAGHQLYEQQYASRRWETALPIGSGSGVRSAPSLLLRARGERDVFFWGPGRRLWTMSYTGFWSDATELTEAGTLGSSPDAVLDARGVAHVFWRGTDRWLYEMSDAGGVWSIASRMNSGEIGSAPAAVARPDGTLDVFWMGRDRQLWRLRNPGSGQFASAIHGTGTVASAPAAILDNNDVEDVFWRGTDRALWELSGPGRQDAISQPALSGPMGSPPSAVVHPGSPVQDVFWRGTDGGLWEDVWYSGEWHPRHVPGAAKLGSRPVAAVSR